MEFDFYQRYKNASDEELLKVLQHPEQYQPPVIEAINRILEERGTSAVALQASIIPEETLDDVQPDGRRDLLTDDWQETKPPVWITVALVVVAIQFAWGFLLNFRDVYQLVTSGHFTFSYLIYSFHVVYIPVTGYLLLKRRTWGWILLFVWELFLLMMAFVWITRVMWYANFYLTDLIAPLWRFTLDGALIFCCWRPVMMRYFGVTEVVRRKSLTIGFGVSIMLVIITYLTW